MAPMEVISLFLVKTKAFTRHFVATGPPPTLPPYSRIGVLVVLTMPVKRLSICKMVGNPVSYPVHSRYNELF